MESYNSDVWLCFFYSFLSWRSPLATETSVAIVSGDPSTLHYNFNIYIDNPPSQTHTPTMKVNKQNKCYTFILNHQTIAVWYKTSFHIINILSTSCPLYKQKINKFWFFFYYFPTTKSLVIPSMQPWPDKKWFAVANLFFLKVENTVFHWLVSYNNSVKQKKKSCL